MALRNILIMNFLINGNYQGLSYDEVSLEEKKQRKKEEKKKKIAPNQTGALLWGFETMRRQWNNERHGKTGEMLEHKQITLHVGGWTPVTSQGMSLMTI